MINKVKKFISVFAIICIILSAAPLQSVYASPTEEYKGGKNGDGRGICAYGIDLSEWQGDQVDFRKIREQGISFVILRAGFSVHMDACFEINYAAAKEAGLNVGVYLYSYAENSEEALNEANALKKWLEGKTLEYPVYYDIEEPDLHSSMEPARITEIALAFMDSMAADGWLTGLYSCKSWLDQKIETEKVCSRYECWMAMYLPDGTCDTYDKYDEYCGMWQYSSTGTVEGVPGNADMNVAFKDYPSICAEFGYNGYLGLSQDYAQSSAIEMPEISVPGDPFSLTGQLDSDDGPITEISLCLWDQNGNLAAENHSSPQNESFDLSYLSLETQKLYSGEYKCRLTMATQSGISLIKQGKVTFSPAGIKAGSIEIPPDLLVGEEWKPAGQIRASSSITEVRIDLLNENGNIMYSAIDCPDTAQYQLSAFASRLEFEKLKQGVYRYQVSAATQYGTEILTDGTFHIWVENDPVVLRDFTLKEEYHPGDPRVFDGKILSENSELQDVGVIIRKLSADESMTEVHAGGGRTLSLNSLADKVQLNRFTCGRYLCTITAVNAAGPTVLEEKVFSVLPDDLSLCEVSVPSVLKIGDSFMISGVIASDDSLLKLVSVQVTDEKNQVLLDAAVSPESPIYDLSDIADRLIFSALFPGEYRLSIRGENEHVSELLCDSEFTVTSADDLIRWKGDHFRPDGLSFPYGDAIKLQGVLVSDYSFIESISAEIYGSSGRLISSGKLLPMEPEAEISELNSQLHLASLSPGTYRLNISAENEESSFVMLNEEFAISECRHNEGTVGKIYEPRCDRIGAVCDTRCEICGGKVCSGSILEKTGHEFSDGRCISCGKKECEVYTLKKADTVQSGRGYVIACKEGSDWFAIDKNGRAQYISPPDENMNIVATADEIWILQYRGEKVHLLQENGCRLHLDSAGITSARGAANGDLLFEPDGEMFYIKKSDRKNLGISFENRQFKTGGRPSALYVFELCLENS